LDNYNEYGKKDGHCAENSGEKDYEIKKGDHLHEGQREAGREFHDAAGRQQKKQVPVGAGPYYEIDEYRERSCKQGGNGTGTV
jgi:hypothetical protein